MLYQGAEGAITSAAGLYTKGAGAMVTYADLFTFVIMLCAVATLAIYAARKK